MKISNLPQLKLLFCTAFFCSLSYGSHAGIPVTDPGTLAQTIENNINLGLEFKSVKKVVELAGTINTTIGDSISTFNEYVDTYNQYKDKVNNVLDEADKYTGMVDGVLGTNLGGVVDGAQGVTDGITNAGDSIVNKGNEYAGIGADIQGGINSGLGAINDFKNKQNNKNGNTAEGAPAADNTNTSGGSNTTGGSASGGTSGLGMTSALTGPGTNNGYAVLPNELADYCGIQAADINDVTKKGVVVNCLKKLITYRNSKTLEDQRAARDIYVKSFHDTAYANVAEAVVMRNYAVNYEREVLTPLSEKLKKAKTIRDDYSGVVIVNKEVANLLNRILMVYASKVSFDALRDYGDFEIYPEDLLELD